MNWVFDTYSNVYSTAMMQSQSAGQNAASAKESRHGKRRSILGLFGRR